MGTGQTSALRRQGEAPESPKPKHYWILYLLMAGLVLAAVSVTLYFTHDLIGGFRDSVRNDQVWTARLDQYAELEDLAFQVDAPGNDVFLSRDVDAESRRMLSALQRFNAAAAAEREDLKNNLSEVQGTGLTKDLDRVISDTKDIAAEAEAVFSYFKQGRRDKAGERMAIMDRKYSEVDKTLTDMRRQVRDSLRNAHQRQSAAAHSMAEAEYFVMALILIMAGGAIFYGYTITRRMETTAREKERYLARLQQSERTLHDVLEGLPVAVRIIQDGKLAFANPQDGRMFGYQNPAEQVGADALAHVAEEDRERLRGYAQQRAAGLDAPSNYEAKCTRRDGTIFPVEVVATQFQYAEATASLVVLLDRSERQRLRMYEQILPICCMCGKIRDDSGAESGKGTWEGLDQYVARRSEVLFSHGFCPECLKKYRETYGM